MAGPGTRIGFLLQDPQRLLPGFSDVGAFVGIGFRGILDYGYNDVYYSNYSLAIMRGAAELMDCYFFRLQFLLGR